MHLLLVEDDPTISRFLVRGLREENHVVDLAEDAEAAEQFTSAADYDAILLDVMLPGDADGFTLCQRMRQSGIDTPVLMLTARDGVADRVHGLDIGADDYLTKPFGIRELVARVRALLRRPRASKSPRQDEKTVIEAGPLVLDRPRREARLNGTIIELTPHEFDVLFALTSSPGVVFTREMLLARVWSNDTHVTERSVDTLVKRLRQKIEQDPREPKLILTVWGTGYKFADV